ncbi:MAG: family 16 glycoside hydrolase, partial [Pirellulales bacterium]
LESRNTASTTPNTNGGFQFRSRRLPNGDVAGYQVDNNFGQRWKVRLYDEFGRHDLALEGERSVFDLDGRRQVEPLTLSAGARDFRLDDWHEYYLTARGNHLALRINGALVAECTDNDPQQFEPLGVLALQLHTGPPMKAQFRNVRLKRLAPEVPLTPRQLLLATAALDWQLGERPAAHQPPLAVHGRIETGLPAEGPDADPKACIARLDGAYCDAGDAWNVPGDALTVYVRARMPDGNWTQPLMSKGSDDALNFRLFSADLPSTPGPDIGLEIDTGRRTYRVAFPVSQIDATAWHDLVGRYTGRNLELICDGKVMVRVDAKGMLSTNDEPVLIGGEMQNGQVARTLAGELQEAAVWTRALTDEDVSVLTRKQ